MSQPQPPSSQSELIAAGAAAALMTVAQFVQFRRMLSNRLSSALTGMFRGLGSWRDPDSEKFVAQAVPLVQGAQRALASVVSIYVADQAARATDRTVAPPAIPDSAVVNLRGVDPAAVYRRPFVTTYVALSRGDDLPTAVDRGVTRLEQVAEGDMQQTHSNAVRAAMQALPEDVAPSGWRRVPQGPRTCGLCIVASTKLYGVEALNPLHGGCDCSVEAVFGSHPSVGPERKAAVKAALEEIGAGRNYRNLRGLVVEHGELGPMLVRPKDHFSE